MRKLWAGAAGLEAERQYKQLCHRKQSLAAKAKMVMGKAMHLQQDLHTQFTSWLFKHFDCIIIAPLDTEQLNPRKIKKVTARQMLFLANTGQRVSQQVGA
jgi:hypothetical protein